MVRQLSYLLGSYVTHVRTVFKLRILRAARNSLKHQRPHSSRLELSLKHSMNTVIAAHIKSRLSLIVRVNVILNRIVVVDSD